MGTGTKGEIEAAICNIHTHLIGDLLVVRLQGVLTAAEQQLVKTLPADKGRGLLKQVRTQLMETARPALEDRLTRLGLANRVTLVGLVPPGQIPLYLSAMDVLVHPSYWEGLSRALPQALLAGLPVVSYDIDGAREVVKHGENGFLLPTGDVEQLSWAIETLFTSPSLRQKMGNRFRAQLAEMLGLPAPGVPGKH